MIDARFLFGFAVCSKASRIGQRWPSISAAQAPRPFTLHLPSLIRYLACFKFPRCCGHISASQPLLLGHRFRSSAVEVALRPCRLFAIKFRACIHHSATSRQYTVLPLPIGRHSAVGYFDFLGQTSTLQSLIGINLHVVLLGCRMTLRRNSRCR